MDFKKAEMLLNIIDKAKQWPTELRHIHNAAMKELLDMREDRVPDEYRQPPTGPRPTIQPDDKEELERRV